MPSPLLSSPSPGTGTGYDQVLLLLQESVAVPARQLPGGCENLEGDLDSWFFSVR